MTQARAPDSTAQDPTGAALAEALPELRRIQIQGWAGMAAAAVVTLLMGTAIWQLGSDAMGWAIMAYVFGAFGVVGIGAWVKRSHEARVMPIIASTLGLSHQKQGKWFVDQIPTNFIPRGGKQQGDDLMSGKIADRPFRFAEVKTETGGKNSSTLFDGVVIELATREPLPEFLIAPSRQTRGFWFFKGNLDVANQTLWHSEYGTNGEEYGLWSPSDRPGEREVMQALMIRMIDLGGSLGSGSSLYSVACTGRDIYVALRHKHEMFRIGGAFATEADIMANIRTASDELAVPLRLAAEIVRAEEALHAAAAKA